MEDAAATEHSEDPEAAKKDETAIAEVVTHEKTQIPEAATEHSESSKATKEDKTAIPEAATEHSEIRRLLILANKESRSGEAAKDHSETPEAACQEMKRYGACCVGVGAVFSEQPCYRSELVVHPTYIVVTWILLQIRL